MTTPTRSHRATLRERERAADATDAAESADVANCEGLRKVFGERVAVDGVGFTIATGETYGLLGPNGAGKTTTISMLCGLFPPDTGSVVIAGRALDGQAHAAKAAIGLVPQEIALYPDLSARENLDFFGRLQGLDRHQRRARIDEVLEVVGLADRADDRVGEYSGGMQRRCNIAVGLLHQPMLLVLDEPTVGVDPQSRNQILDSIEALGGVGLSVLYTTHYMEEAERLCDRIGIMDAGRMIAEGTHRQLHRPRSASTTVSASPPATPRPRRPPPLGGTQQAPSSTSRRHSRRRRGSGRQRPRRDAWPRSSAGSRMRASVEVSGVEVDRARPGDRVPPPDRPSPAGLSIDAPTRRFTIAANDLRRRGRDRSALIQAFLAPGRPGPDHLGRLRRHRGRRRDHRPVVDLDRSEPRVGPGQRGGADRRR